jgi:hypothetical protein
MSDREREPAGKAEVADVPSPDLDRARSYLAFREEKVRRSYFTALDASQHRIARSYSEELGTIRDLIVLVKEAHLTKMLTD